MQIYWTKINKIIDETPEVKTFLLDCPEDFHWEEGAHTHFALEGFNAGEKPNRSLVRHMSISTLPKEKAIGITTRIREQCSEFKSILKNIEVGSKVPYLKQGRMCPFKELIKIYTYYHQELDLQRSDRLCLTISNDQIISTRSTRLI